MSVKKRVIDSVDMTNLNNNSTNTNSVTLHKTTIGMEKILKSDDKNDKKIKEKIDLDIPKMIEVINLCVKDLSYPRKLLFKKEISEVVFIKEYNDKQRLITFNYSIDELNSMLKVNEKDLGDFFSSYLYMNLQNYCMQLFNATCLQSPILSINREITIIPNAISIDFA